MSDERDGREEEVRSVRDNHVREQVRETVQIPHAGRCGLLEATLHTRECDEEDLIELPDGWMPVRLEHNSYAAPSRKAHTLYHLVRA